MECIICSDWLIRSVEEQHEKRNIAACKKILDDIYDSRIWLFLWLSITDIYEIQEATGLLCVNRTMVYGCITLGHGNRNSHCDYSDCVLACMS